MRPNGRVVVMVAEKRAGWDIDPLMLSASGVRDGTQYAEVRRTHLHRKCSTPTKTYVPVVRDVIARCVNARARAKALN